MTDKQLISKLKQTRIALGLTQEQAAHELGFISGKFYYNTIETGKQPLNPRTRKTIEMFIKEIPK